MMGCPHAVHMDPINNELSGGAVPKLGSTARLTVYLATLFLYSVQQMRVDTGPAS